MTTKVLCFGNEFLESDRLAKEIASDLSVPGVEFVFCKDPAEIMDYAGEGRIIILDVAKGIDEVIVVDDIEKIKTRNIASLHDFDLGFFLKLIEKAGWGVRDKIRIICVPMELAGDNKKDKEKIKREVAGILDELRSSR